MISKLRVSYFIIIIISSIFYLFPYAMAQYDYEEEISTTIIGNSAYWSINLTGGNITIPRLESIESEIPQIQGFDLLTIDRSSWNPEFELFLPWGYNILKFEALPDSGIFLSINSEDEDSAKNLAESFSEIFELSFIKYSTEGNHYIYFSNTDFNIITEKIWQAVPANYGGIADYINKESFLLNEVSILGFSGKKIGADFSHTLILGGLESDVIRNSNEFRLIDIVPNINNTESSVLAKTSSIRINLIGGFITYSNLGEVKNYGENRSALLSFQVEKGMNFPEINIDIGQKIPSLISVREVDKAVLNNGEIVSIGIRVRNNGEFGSIPISKITVDDNWWLNSNDFEFVDGETSRNLGFLAPGAEFTLAYRLRVISEISKQITVPQSFVKYEYEVVGGEIQEEIILNEVSLILNDVRPALNVVASIQSSSPPILDSTFVNLTITNSGEGAATDLRIINESRQSLLSGDSWLVQIEIFSNSLKDLDKKLVWNLTWNEGGEKRQAKSNSLIINYDLSGSHIPKFDLIRNIFEDRMNENIIVNEEITIINRGTENLNKISILDELNSGLEYINGNLTLQNKILSIETKNIESNQKATYSYKANIIDEDNNYIFQPAKIIVSAGNSNIIHLTETKILPLGIKVLKIFNTTKNFVGANISIRSTIINNGDLPIYKVGLSIGKDSFLKILNGKESLESDILKKDESLEIINKGIFLDTGEFESKYATATFILAGSLISQNSKEKIIEIYEPIKAEFTIKPRNPIEGQEFTLILKINNPTNLPVFNIKSNPDLPEVIQILDGDFRISEDILRENNSIVKIVKAIVDSPEKIIINQPKVFFTYGDSVYEGISNPLEVSIIDNIPIRYGLPLLVGLVLIIITSYLSRKRNNT